MTEVIILRHGETEAQDILKGSLDTAVTELSEEGLLNTIITARALRDYKNYKDAKWFGFAHGHYRRTTQTGGIVEHVVPGKYDVQDERHLPSDEILRTELLGATRLEIKGLHERHFGSLQEIKFNVLTPSVIQEVTGYANLEKLLLYGGSEDFYNLAKKLGVKEPEWGEGFSDFFKRAYDVSAEILDIISKVDRLGETSVLVLTTHLMFGCALYNALYNSILAYHYPEAFEDDKKYAKHLLRYHDLKPCHFARLDISIINKYGRRTPDCTGREVNDWQHLACKRYMSNDEKTNLIAEARSILKGSSGEFQQ